MQFLRFCLLGCIVVSFLPLLQRLEVRFAAFDAFAPQCAAGNLLLVAALLIFCRRLRSTRWWAIAGLVGAAWSTFIFWPELSFRHPDRSHLHRRRARNPKPQDRPECRLRPPADRSRDRTEGG